MRVFIANFGEGNYEWPVCKERSTIATMNEFIIEFARHATMTKARRSLVEWLAYKLRNVVATSTTSLLLD